MSQLTTEDIEAVVARAEQCAEGMADDAKHEIEDFATIHGVIRDLLAALAQLQQELESVERARDRYLWQLKRINDILHPTEVARVRATGDLRCSFCDEHQNNVAKLIAGQNVWICDRCVDACRDLITSDGSGGEPSQLVDAVAKGGEVL